MRNGQSFEIRGGGGPDTTGVLSVPAAMRRATPPGARFVPEWHPDGILYRYIGTTETPEESLPPWGSNRGHE